MNKVTKKKQIEDLQTVVAAQWRQINKLKLVVGRLTDDWPDDDHEQADHDAVIAILDSKEPKLKQLDQSVFDGADPKYITAATNEYGRTFLFPVPKSELEHALGCWFSDYRGDSPRVDGLFDASDWQNSLIERDKVELTGSDLTEQIMKNQKYQPAFVSDESEQDAINSQRTALIDNVYMSDRDYRFRAELAGYRYAVAINNQGEPLTATDVGL